MLIIADINLFINLLRFTAKVVCPPQTILTIIANIGAGVVSIFNIIRLGDVQWKKYLRGDTKFDQFFDPDVCSTITENFEKKVKFLRGGFMTVTVWSVIYTGKYRSLRS